MKQTIPVHERAGGVTAPAGFVAGAVYCGIRKVKKDIAVVASTVPATVAAVFTLNKTQAAPIVVDRIQLKRSDRCSAVVINSGNANACTGERGMNDAWEMIRTTAKALALPEKEILVSSTGVIGQYLPMEKVLSGIQRLAAGLSASGNADAAEAIMTTDTFAKETAVQFSLGGSMITIGGMAKGSGMIAPNMATMLAFITTDAAIDQALLQKALSRANNRSFNRITVDGDMSTNDMALVLANGTAGNKRFGENTEEFHLFCAALEYVMVKLAKMIARDGEGATKLIEVFVKGARTEENAAQTARSVANSNLVKTALHGCDANWGRIMAAVGYSGVDFDPDMVEIQFNGLPILEKHYSIVLDEEKVKQTLAQDEILVTIDLNQGSQSARFWTCDLTKEYVHINASYRS